jgi:DNA-directed RNA polymerase beta' subunit
MAVHVPLSEAAQYEAREVMAANLNILKPGSGDPVVSAKLLDIILGCFWVTKAQDKAMIKKAIKQHDQQEHKGGKGTVLKLKKGGVPAYNKSPKIC